MRTYRVEDLRAATHKLLENREIDYKTANDILRTLLWTLDGTIGGEVLEAFRTRPKACQVLAAARERDTR